MSKRYNRIKRLVKEDQVSYTGTRDLNGGWRKKILSENDWTAVRGSIANSTAQTFVHTTGATTTVSGLGGVETTPSTVTIDAFGDTFDVPAPEYSQLGMQGYAPPLGGVQRKTQQTENEKINAEQRKLKEQIIQLEQKRDDLLEEQNQKKPKYIGLTNDELVDRKKEITKKWRQKQSEIIWRSKMSKSEIDAAHAKYWEYEDARRKELNAVEAQSKRDEAAHIQKLKAHYDAYSKKIDSVWNKEQALYAKIDELEKQRPINQQLDASQQAYPNLPFTGARVQSAVGTRQSSFSTSDTSPDTYDDYLRDEGMEDPQDGSDGPQYSRFGPFRSDLHYQFEVGKISERYRKKIDAVYDYYADGAGAYSSMRPVMNLEAERDSLIRELTIKKTAQDRSYNKAFDRYVKQLEAEKLARRARAAAAPAPPGSVPLPVGPSIWSSGSTTPPPALRDYRNTPPLSPARYTSPISPAMSANIGTAGKIMTDYLTKGWNNRVVADNEYLGRDYIDKQFFPNVEFHDYKTHVGGGDAVVGNGQPPRVDPETGEIVVRANFDFNTNEHEAFGEPDPDDKKQKIEYAKRLERLKSLGLFDYTLDSMMDFLPGPLQIPAALLVSPFVAGSKSIGRGNNIPIVIRFTPQELKRKNKKQYDKLVNMGLIKESTWDKINKHRSIKEHQTPYTGKRNLTGGWRKKIISENNWTPVAGSIANSTGQTFVYPGGSRVTVSGLGGVESTPSTVTIGFEGETIDVPGPNYSQLGLQGYAPPLGKKVMRRDAEQNKERRAELDAKLNKLSSEPLKVQQDFYDKWNKIKKALPPMPKSLGIYMRLDPVKALATMDLNAEERDYLKALAKYEKDFESAKKNDLGKKLDSIAKEREPLEKEYDYLLGMTSDVNPKLDASQEFAQNVDSDYMMNARVQDPPDPIDYDPRSYVPPDPSVPLDYDPLKGVDAPDPSVPLDYNPPKPTGVDPYADRILELNVALDKMKEKGTLISRYKLIGPGEEGYVDTTKMANAIGYNRKPIYTAPAQEMFAELERLYALQLAWLEKQNPGGAVPGADDALDDYNSSMGPNSEPPEDPDADEGEEDDNELLNKAINLLNLGLDAAAVAGILFPEPGTTAGGLARLATRGQRYNNIIGKALKWYNKGRKPGEHKMSRTDRMRDEWNQRGKFGKGENLGGWDVFRGFRPGVPADKGGFGSGPTPSFRQAIERQSSGSVSPLLRQHLRRKQREEENKRR